MTSVSGWAIRSPLPLANRTECIGYGVLWPQSDGTWGDAAQERQLEALGALEENWDGYGAAHIKAETLKNARWFLKFVSQSRRPDFIVPNPAGTVIFEWETPFGEAQLELGKSTFGFYTSPNAGSPIMLGGPIEVLNAHEIRSALAGILSSTIAHAVADSA